MNNGQSVLIPEIDKDPCPMARTAFWRQVVALITDEDLHEISRADGGIDADLNYIALRQLIDPKVQDFCLDWNPREPLELTRWTKPQTELPRERNLAIYRQNLFASTALLIGSSIPDYAGGIVSITENIAILIESFLALELHSWQDLQDFLTQIEPRINPHYDDIAFIHAAKTIVTLLSPTPDPQVATIETQKIITNLTSIWSEMINAKNTVLVICQPWDRLLRSTFFDQRIDLWRQLLDKSLERSSSLGFQEVTTALVSLRE
jgi:hypothetical protein